MRPGYPSTADLTNLAHAAMNEVGPITLGLPTPEVVLALGEELVTQSRKSLGMTLNPLSVTKNR